MNDFLNPILVFGMMRGYERIRVGTLVTAQLGWILCQPQDCNTKEAREIAANTSASVGLARKKERMAAAITASAVKPKAAVHGLCGASLPSSSRKLSMSSRRIRMPKPSKRNAVVAKYGDKSVYFDLEDISNTTGAWDLYGSDAPSPYNPLQSKFFETVAGPFTKRGLLLKFLVLGGGGALAYASSHATGDILPIVKGPQGPPTLGPRGKI